MLTQLRSEYFGHTTATTRTTATINPVVREMNKRAALDRLMRERTTTAATTTTTATVSPFY